MATARSALTTELDVWRAFLRGHHAVYRKLEAELEREHGMTLPYYEVLMHLASSPERRMRMTDLARSVLLSPSGLTRLVDRLVRDGLVIRAPCPTDARSLYAVLTDDGWERFQRAARTHVRGIRQHFLARLDERQRRELREALEQLID